jgi:hypothetical protein
MAKTENISQIERELDDCTFDCSDCKARVRKETAEAIFKAMDYNIFNEYRGEAPALFKYLEIKKKFLGENNGK